MKGTGMCRVKAKVVRGAAPSERVAYIKTTEGYQAEVLLDSKQAGADHVVASEIGRRQGEVLIELPQESSSGEWRVWVRDSQIMK